MSLLRLPKPHETGIALVLAGLLVGSCATVEAPLGPIGGEKADGQVVATQDGKNTDIDCPGVTVRSGAAAWQMPAGGRATEVRYQGAIGQLVRECAILGETMTMRVGVEGRLLVGPKGGPGTVNVPIRLALVSEGPKPEPIWTNFYNVAVEVPAGASQAVFSIVEDDLTFQLPASRRVDNYVVYVGFDPQTAAASKTKQKTAPRPAAPRPAPAPKAAPKAPAPKAPAPAPAQQAPKQQPGFEPPPQQQQPQFEPAPSPPPGVFAPPPGHQ